MYSCKLGSLALLLALSASHHFILLHCQEPSNAPELTPSDYVPPSDYGPPSPPPPLPPTPTPSYYGQPSDYVPPSPQPPLPPPPTPLYYGPPLLSPPPTPSYYGPPPLPPTPTPNSAPKPPSYYGPPPLPPTPTPNSAPKPMTTPEFGGPKPTPPPNSAPAPTTGKPKTESAPAHASIGVIAGAVIGSVVLIVGLFACFLIWRKRRTRQSAQPPKGKPLFAFKYSAYIGGFGAFRVYFTKREKDQK